MKMRKMMVGFGAIALMLIGMAAPAGAAGEPIEYCDETPTALPQPWSDVYTVPAPSGGAFVSYIELTDELGEIYEEELPSGDLVNPDSAGWVSVQLCEVVPNEAVVGKTLITKVEGRLVGLFGYAYDPGVSDNVQVSVTIDGVWRPQYWTANYPWISTPTFPAEATDKGFLILMGDFPVGEHEICVIGQDIDLPGATSNLGCTRVVVK